MKKLSKGLLMTAITLIATSLATTGIPHDLVSWEVMGITLTGTLLGYFAQSYAFPSTSILGDLNAKDFLKGLCVALANMLSALGAAAATATTIDWANVGSSILMVFIGYIAKQTFTTPTGVPPTKS